MKAIGKTTIEEGLILNNPTAIINSVTYNWTTNKVMIEVIFCEENSEFKHSRSYDFDLLADEVLTPFDNINLIKSVLTEFE